MPNAMELRHLVAAVLSARETCVNLGDLDGAEDPYDQATADVITSCLLSEWRDNTGEDLPTTLTIDTTEDER